MCLFQILEGHRQIRFHSFPAYGSRIGINSARKIHGTDHRSSFIQTFCTSYFTAKRTAPLETASVFIHLMNHLPGFLPYLPGNPDSKQGIYNDIIFSIRPCVTDGKPQMQQDLPLLSGFFRIITLQLKKGHLPACLCKETSDGQSISSIISFSCHNQYPVPVRITLDNHLCNSQCRSLH